MQLAKVNSSNEKKLPNHEDSATEYLMSIKLSHNANIDHDNIKKFFEV
jgi:hypothetical protein